MNLSCVVIDVSHAVQLSSPLISSLPPYLSPSHSHVAWTVKTELVDPPIDDLKNFSPIGPRELEVDAIFMEFFSV